MAGSGSESATELYWHAFAEAEEEEIGSCVGPDAAAPSSAALFNAAGSSAAAPAAAPSDEAMEVLPQYSVGDDRLLCNAWLSTPSDPLTGRHHRGTFWERIGQVFNANSEVFRNEGSIRHRWGTIVAEINKFSGCFAQMGSIDEAVMLYNALGGKPETTEWKFGHCWDMLKDSPFVDYTPNEERKDMIRRVETQARQARRARQREREAHEREEAAAAAADREWQRASVAAHARELEREAGARRCLRRRQRREAERAAAAARGPV